jgi:branched-chain amino acid transport system ATP-binding protein
MSTRILDIEDLKVRYSGLPVLQGVSLHVDAGETVSVLGANGAGKSTLLRAVMGAQPAFEGHIRFEGREIQQLQRPTSCASASFTCLKKRCCSAPSPSRKTF